jgi:hypothetical protein
VSQPQTQAYSSDPPSKIDWSLIRSSYEVLTDAEPKDGEPKVDLADILAGKISSSSDYAPPLEKARLYAERLDARINTGEGGGGGHAFINGRHFDVDDVRVFLNC